MEETQGTDSVKPRYDERCEEGETFLGVVPLSAHKVILAYRRKRHARRYVRMRIWNLHREKLVWYPTTRYFIVPMNTVQHLGYLLYNAAELGAAGKPDWLQAHECGVNEQLWALRAVGVPDEKIEAHQRSIEGYSFEESLVPLVVERFMERE